MRQFQTFSFSILVTAMLFHSTTGRAQVVTNLTDPTYLAVIQNLNGSANAPCGISGSNQYAICTGGGIPLNYFASNASVDSKIAAAFAAFQQPSTQALQVATQAQQAAIQAQQLAAHAQRGVTAVAAMANSWMPSAPGRTTWAVNGSTFQGEIGAGFSLAHRLPLSFPIAVTAAYGNGAGSAHVGRIGLMGEF